MPTSRTNRLKKTPLYSSALYTYNDIRLNYSDAIAVHYAGRTKPTTAYSTRTKPSPATSYAVRTKPSTTWIPRLHPGLGWAYDQAGITFDQLHISYESQEPASIWTDRTKP